eukprot:TRINITY_DN3762_c0_g1_i1.p1 TRINITY_DN3762_c0_g1~~TRINITY_DN3762_c0_g1_i1.p1  ORF type:complete len:284 (-),score=83.41 TRINITY_DN3762_c0_g1_i1:69-920(-)
MKLSWSGIVKSWKQSKKNRDVRQSWSQEKMESVLYASDVFSREIIEEDLDGSCMGNRRRGSEWIEVGSFAPTIPQPFHNNYFLSLQEEEDDDEDDDGGRGQNVQQDHDDIAEDVVVEDAQTMKIQIESDSSAGQKMDVVHIIAANGSDAASAAAVGIHRADNGGVYPRRFADENINDHFVHNLEQDDNRAGTGFHRHHHHHQQAPALQFLSRSIAVGAVSRGGEEGLNAAVNLSSVVLGGCDDDVDMEDLCKHLNVEDLNDLDQDVSNVAVSVDTAFFRRPSF